jgi:hypothetical protein
MAIPASNPTEQAAVEARVYPDLWIKSIVIRTANAQQGYIKIETLAYDGATQEISNSRAESITTDKLLEAAAQVPEVAAAYSSILAAVAPLRQWIADDAAAADAAE